MNTYARTYTLMQTAKLLGMNRNRACRWAAAGIIRTTKIPIGKYGRHIVAHEELQRVRGLISGKTDDP